jgi:transcriptional regulator with AAA-type ATPase domain
MFSDTLFGHKKGAFTGADDNRQGLIAKASGGVLFLDEIGDLQSSPR